MNKLYDQPRRLTDTTASLLPLVATVDAWPYWLEDPAKYREVMADYFYFMIKGYAKPFGYVHRSIVDQVPWTDVWKVERDPNFLTLCRFDTLEDRTAAMQSTLRVLQGARISLRVRRWTNELVPVYSAEGEHVLDMDGCGDDLFGVPSTGVHMTAWTESEKGRMYWVQRRAFTKASHPGKLDVAVGGGLLSNERPIDGMVREVMEEALLPEKYIRKRIQSRGTLSYCMAEDSLEQPAYQPHTQYVYEMEVDNEVAWQTSEEVDSFHLMSYAQVRAALDRGEFKPIARLVWIAHFIRHGYVTAENEPNLADICARLHRKHTLFIAL